MTQIKQIILVRTDLKMPSGKLAAQVAHASTKAVTDLLVFQKGQQSFFVRHSTAIIFMTVLFGVGLLLDRVAQAEPALADIFRLGQIFVWAALGVELIRLGVKVMTEKPSKTRLVLNNPPEELLSWLSGSYTKVCVRVSSERELLEIIEKAKAAGLLTSLITDEGRTFFEGMKTRTCGAIGPAKTKALESLTNHLKLL